MTVTLERIDEVQREPPVVARSARRDDPGHVVLATGPRLLHVVRLAISVGPPPIAKGFGRRAVTGVEGRLLSLEKGRAHAPGLHRRERLGIEVVVVEVFVRDHSHRPDPFGSE